MATRMNGFEPGMIMTCDGGGVIACGHQVRRAPRIVVPSRTPKMRGHTPLRIMTTVHYCDLHAGSFKLDDYWTDTIKRRVEDRGKQLRPPGWRPDFEAARVETVLVTTPEYRAFLRAHGLHNVAA